jgi:hypothetical protein
MRVARLSGALFAGLLMACDFVAALPEPPASAKVSEAAADAEGAPAAIPRAPTVQELLRSCPLEAVFFRDFRKHLDVEEFAEVDAILDTLREGYRKTPACESHLWEAMDFLASMDFRLLDSWVAARPGSWGAFTARGTRWVETGYSRRGRELAKDVTEAQWAGMRDAFAHAETDLKRAIDLDPDGYVAYGRAIYMLKASGGSVQIRKVLDALLARDPFNYGVRRRAMQSLIPKWGGSLEEMRQVAAEAQPFADRNPRLRILPGFAEAEAAEIDIRAKRYKEASRGFRRALAYGGYHDWYDDLAWCLSKLGFWAKVVETSDAWIAELGDCPDARMRRGDARIHLGDYAGAVADLDVAHAGEPLKAYTIQRRALAHWRLGHRREAIEDLRLSLQIEPGNAWALEQLRAVEAHDAKSGRVEEMPVNASSDPQP